MIAYGHGILGYILAFLSVIFALLIVILSLVVILIILYHLRHHHRQLKREEKITLVLSSHIYLYILIFAMVSISMNIQSLIGDVYGNNFDSAWCILQGFLIFTSVCMIFCGFFVQAIFRLFRIVYPNYPRLQSHRFFLASAPIVIVQASIFLSPVGFWGDIVYLPKDYYCLVEYTKIRSVFWLMCVCYNGPLFGLLLIHLRITIFLRQQSPNTAAVIKQKQQRDLVVLRRIFINVGLLLVTGLPATVIALMARITGSVHPLGQRITCITAGISFAVLSIQMILMTPQLKRLILKRWQVNRVTTIEHRAQTTPIENQ